MGNFSFSGGNCWELEKIKIENLEFLKRLKILNS